MVIQSSLQQISEIMYSNIKPKNNSVLYYFQSRSLIGVSLLIIYIYYISLGVIKVNKVFKSTCQKKKQKKKTCVAYHPLLKFCCFLLCLTLIKFSINILTACNSLCIFITQKKSFLNTVLWLFPYQNNTSAILDHFLLPSINTVYYKHANIRNVLRFWKPLLLNKIIIYRT